ncbi:MULTISPECIES: phosphoserine phosphatase SerB [unclassified Sphingomonas]|uniref:phosphoserine phosphatase SerB n=1 Tax=unclassified Sphingomonas TaxID=196159 RepID=UPI00161B71D1|nr:MULTISPECIES: phosphoserine phosphatase SerB [unclassified Sphingomonas]MBB3345750.1 phosphoserine phosphatase [Sphingomonas sp. BK069]MBB3474625.1 phosphoserine phosphatase [Sphingomonas sp. BK345]
MFTATLIAAGRLTPNIVAAAQERLAAAGCAPTTLGWIDEGDAADLHFELAPADARAGLEGLFEAVDVVVQPRETRRKMLLVADMDSTMITVECIDELADYAGLKPQIAAITERAMRGELDFEAALDARVGLLKGLRGSVIQECLDERVRLMPGATTLVRTMRAWGATAVLVSGGFTRFAEPVANAIGFHRAIANVLELEDGVLTGTVARPIVGAATKRTTLLETRAALGLADSATLAVGDGANDLAMIEVAGLGVAYRAKPIVAAAAAARVEHGDLAALLWAQGVPKAEWVA